MADENAPRIVSAVGTAVGLQSSGDAGLATRLEEAMRAAVEKALDEGVSLEDSKTILRLKEEARQAVLDGSA